MAPGSVPASSVQFLLNSTVPSHSAASVPRNS